MIKRLARIGLSTLTWQTDGTALLEHRNRGNHTSVTLNFMDASRWARHLLNTGGTVVPEAPWFRMGVFPDNALVYWGEVAANEAKRSQLRRGGSQQWR